MIVSKIQSRKELCSIWRDGQMEGISVPFDMCYEEDSVLWKHMWKDT